MAKKAAGRPKGSKHKDRPVADEQIAQCPHCGSCNRGQFGSVSRINKFEFGFEAKQSDRPRRRLQCLEAFLCTIR